MVKLGQSWILNSLTFWFVCLFLKRDFGAAGAFEGVFRWLIWGGRLSSTGFRGHLPIGGIFVTTTIIQSQMYWWRILTLHSPRSFSLVMQLQRRWVWSFCVFWALVWTTFANWDPWAIRWLTAVDAFLSVLNWYISQSVNFYGATNRVLASTVPNPSCVRVGICSTYKKAVFYVVVLIHGNLTLNFHVWHWLCLVRREEAKVFAIREPTQILLLWLVCSCHFVSNN